MIVQNYVKPDHVFFGFFPWAAFVAFGMSVGSVLRILKPEDVQVNNAVVSMGRFDARVLGIHSFEHVALNLREFDFWLNSPAL